ncbi:hypothetical protein U1Q18_051203, partial [Sarracenia purpurea var. burkii]
GEMQQLRDKLAIAERTAKAEAQLKEKYQLRFKVLEEKLKASPNGISRIPTEARSINNGHSRRQSLGGVENLSRLPSNGFLSRKANGHSGHFQSNSGSALLKQAKISSRSFDGGSRSLEREKPVRTATEKNGGPTDDAGDQIHSREVICSHEENGVAIDKTKAEGEEDYVSGMLYDVLQKEVITLRKACHEKDQSLKDKEDVIEMLAKKVETLNKAMEVEAKKVRREVAAMEKEVAAMRISKEQDRRVRRISVPRGAVNGVRLHSSR